MSKPGIILAVVGASSVGKSAIIEEIVKMDRERDSEGQNGAVANQNFRRIFRNSNFFQTHVHLSYAYL